MKTSACKDRLLKNEPNYTTTISHHHYIFNHFANYRIAGKFDRDSDLAVWQLGMKRPNENIIFASNDINHAVASTLRPAWHLSMRAVLHTASYISC